jgi:hypothetical protein
MPVDTQVLVQLAAHKEILEKLASVQLPPLFSEQHYGSKQKTVGPTAKEASRLFGAKK